MIVVGFLIASLISMEFCWIMSLTHRYMQGNIGFNLLYVAPVENRLWLMSCWKSLCVYAPFLFISHVRCLYNVWDHLVNYKITAEKLLKSIWYFPLILLQNLLCTLVNNIQIQTIWGHSEVWDETFSMRWTITPLPLPYMYQLRLVASWHVAQGCRSS